MSRKFLGSMAVVLLVFLGFLLSGCAAQDAKDAEATKYQEYEGSWCDSNNANSTTIDAKGIDEIEIVSIEKDKVYFNVLHTGSMPSYRMTANAELVEGTIDAKGIASFHFKDDRGGVDEGTIEFRDEKLVVKIQPIGTYAANMQGAGGVVAMDCVMLRDNHHGARVAQSSSAKDSSYVLSGSDVRILKDDDVQYLMPKKLELARNEIFARHGRQFDDAEIADYFNGKTWYHATIPASQFDPQVLSETERANVEFIKHWEDKCRSMSNGTSFVGVKGTYKNASVPSDNPSLVIDFDGSDRLKLDITGTLNKTVYYTGLTCTIIDDTTATVQVQDAKLELKWSNPGLLTVKCVSGTLPSKISAITENQSYGNKGYLHVG